MVTATMLMLPMMPMMMAMIMSMMMDVIMVMPAVMATGAVGCKAGWPAHATRPHGTSQTERRDAGPPVRAPHAACATIASARWRTCVEEGGRRRTHPTRAGSCRRPSLGGPVAAGVPRRMMSRER